MYFISNENISQSTLSIIILPLRNNQVETISQKLRDSSKLASRVQHIIETKRFNLP